MNAKSDFASHYWYIFIWGSYTDRTPVLKTEASTATATTSLAYSETPDIDISALSLETLDSKTALQIIKKSNYEKLENENTVRFVKKINGCYTNDYILYDKKTSKYYTSRNKINDSDIKKIDSVQGACEIQDLVKDGIKIGNILGKESYYLMGEKGLQKIIRIQFEYCTEKGFEDIDEVYYNDITGEIYSDAYVDNLFN